MKHGINLDDPQRETEKLLELLKDRHPGLSTWNESLEARIDKIRCLICEPPEAK